MIRGKMIRVKLSTNFPDWPLIRQTPGSAGIWGDCQFFINTELDECDYWVVYEDLLKPETTRCPPQNTLLITAEPPSVRKYNRHFAAQFAHVLTCQRDLKHRSVSYGQQAQPWMIGGRYLRDTQAWAETYTKDYDELSALPPVPKTKRLSVIASDKAFTPGHRQRLEFVGHLKQHFGEAIDVYGRGIRDVEDKWEAIAPYQYHVVLENGTYPDYWTEKLSDALLAGAYPFYVGCSNISDYFPGDVLTPLDIRDPDSAVAAIAAGMADNRFEATVTQRQEAKNLVLNTYNLFPMLEQVINSSLESTACRQVLIQPSQQISVSSLETLKRTIKKVIK